MSGIRTARNGQGGGRQLWGLRGEDKCRAGLERAGCGARLERAEKQSMAQTLEGTALWAMQIISVKWK